MLLCIIIDSLLVFYYFFLEICGLRELNIKRFYLWLEKNFKCYKYLGNKIFLDNLFIKKIIKFFEYMYLEFFNSILVI